MPPQDDRVAAPESRWATLAETGFRNLEHGAYLVLGLLLAGASVLALVDAAVGLGHAALDWSGTDSIVAAVDQLLFVFMLIEILHTVRASLRTGGLSCEPFLVVGLIASIRRVLVITLKTSEVTQRDGWSPTTQQMLNGSMLELGVMGGLIVAMVVSIYLLHRARPGAAEPAGSSV
jgi:uncharacterized membrane protein (DUF373 family)